MIRADEVEVISLDEVIEEENDALTVEERGPRDWTEDPQ